MTEPRNYRRASSCKTCLHSRKRPVSIGGRPFRYAYYCLKYSRPVAANRVCEEYDYEA